MAETSEQTIRRLLASYGLGQKIRQLRLKKKIALVELGKHTGLSASMLSQLENGKLVPTLGTLARIAMVFDVGLEFFFADRRRRRPFMIVRSHERMSFPDLPDNKKPNYLFQVLAFASHDKTLQAYFAEFPQRATTEAAEHTHEASELFHVVEGSVAIRYGDEEHILNAGDSVYFDGMEPHSYRGLSREPAKALVVTAPSRV
jgi:transcriptional regulator with XRE-family HTH domain